MRGYRRSHVFFRPISVLYFLFLFLGLLLSIAVAVLVLREVLVRDLGLPPEVISAFMLLSLLGSLVNIPLADLESRVPMFTHRERSFFGVTWYIPRLEIETKRTLVTLNVGGALVPLLTSLYILGYAIPRSDPNPGFSYLKVLVVMAVVIFFVNRSSRLIRGLGIATPTFIPPVTTALATLLIYGIGGPSSPTKIAYVGGTLGTLIGADLLNLHNLSRLGARVVSIGGAGTFDGVYITGLLSVLLVMLV